MSKAQLKSHLLRHLKGGEAFMPIDDLLDKISFKNIGDRPVGLPYSFYEIFYHIKYAQKDILDFCTSEHYALPNWPADYWPLEKTAETKKGWKLLKEDFFTDRMLLTSFIENEQTDLMAVAKHGEKQSVLRELMLVIEHNAYHTGQLAIILRLLGLH
ncbi:DinB family protein [Leeuwenhoekiella sp. W20_SRS_FM14]|uniref:DinB family protein n=1 Tax=Leeuwenhoekiella sp. W20_SRS_FM14 TaxID=3240270 RepID=UPI003F984411